MRGDVDTIKERLDIAEVISGYIKLEKSGKSFKARCPFHNEKTPSFYISPERKSYYCFGCGAKGDIFTFVETMEGLDFREALKLLAERAGVEITYKRAESREEKDKLIDVLEVATQFFEKELIKNNQALKYLVSRGIEMETIKNWRIGYAPAEWRSLFNYLNGLGYERSIILNAGLIKLSDDKAGREPYDVFRDRIIFPLSDQNGKVVAFSGRQLGTESLGPKYLNSPDTILFNKSEVLYGLDKAKEGIRKKNFSVLVEGQIDLVLSHQAGVKNTIATSGTALTPLHLERLRRFSSRIIIAFDGDLAGEKAAEKASILAMALGFEAKVAHLGRDDDPALVIEKDAEEWKNVLKEAIPAIEFFFNRASEREHDPRKLGKSIREKILPMIKLLKSVIEQSYFVSLIAKRTGIKEDVLWEDLKRVSNANIPEVHNLERKEEAKPINDPLVTHRQKIEERLNEIKLWQKELPKSATKMLELEKEKQELASNLSNIILHDELNRLSRELAKVETSKNTKDVENLTHKIQEVHKKIRALEEGKMIM